MKINYKSFNTTQWLSVIVLVGAFLRLYRIDFQSIWIDELHTMIESNPAISFKASFDLIVFREGIPPFYFFITKILFSGFGYTIVVARTLAALVGLFSIYGIYLLANEYVEKKWALVAAFFMAIHPFLIEYSQEARTYTLYMCLTIYLFLFAIKFLKSHTYKHILLFGFLAGLTVNAHIIGFLNVATAFIFLGGNWFFLKEKRKDVFKKLIIGFLVFIIVSLPIIKTLKSVSSYTSFWILKPTATYTVQVFIDLFGGSSLFLITFIIFYGLYLLKSTIHFKSIPKNELLLHNEFQLFVLLNLWIWIEIGVIFIKSIIGVSIVLHRYFIAILPAFVMILMLAIRGFKQAKIQKGILLFTSILILVHFVFIRKYYTTVTKAQYDKIAAFVIENNVEKNTVVSNWGWLMSYYFNSSNEIFSIEKNLDVYLDEMQKNQEVPTTFWYIDGNSRAFQVSPANQKFLEENYIIQNKKEFFDCWAIELKSKKSSDLTINMHRFNPSVFDGSGAMIFVNNGKTAYPSLVLEQGNYTLLFKGKSLPELPINGENAHFNVYLNSQKIGSFNVSEKKESPAIEIGFQHAGGKADLELEFDNDFSQDGQDRNALLNTIQLIKK